MKKPSLEVWGLTDRGCVREVNEDSIIIDEEIGLMVVADGMGGHSAGEVASSIAVSQIRDLARQALGGNKDIDPGGGSPSLSRRGRQLEWFVKTANTTIYKKGREAAKEYGMGTTVVAVLADARSVTVAHVGDSRLYLFRNGALTQLTEDHSLVGDQVRKGLLTSDEASRSTMQNILTRALGTEENVEVDVADHPLLEGDVLLLASDGLTKEVTEEQIRRTIGEGAAPRVFVEKLVAMSRDHGGHDNITVAAARVPTEGWKQVFEGLKKMVIGRGK
ncbi:MAG: Stp1/IreP family PP2C-type Ser/Thr phosphatase [Elusimicrobia bacterium]|nr:Stp1/IreP family PP2C-type Ser/Thr phosphatase [Elusimicrobiota bacterium]